jgi:hypothetical protein
MAVTGRPLLFLVLLAAVQSVSVLGVGSPNNSKVGLSKFKDAIVFAVTL